MNVRTLCCCSSHVTIEDIDLINKTVYHYLSLQMLPYFEFFSSYLCMYLFVAAHLAANLYIPFCISYTLQNPSLRGGGS